ncbi:unnamed protein product [Rangifer tarandus platyrhynchus]|uniref:Uncharacterized protein n=2 Tax=Rangifer tarandus platyrhynchus TaxID=3082113 RepID=A0ACB0E6K7_RANTA|nr:unnamed protein product [Rangifer tarandus platyrhynchus]CAI9695943.1 unnamed protein product [Rangifer tarandus platyrhynchus]
MSSKGREVCALSSRDPPPSRPIFCTHLSDRERRALWDHALQAPPSSWQEPLSWEMAPDPGMGSLTQSCAGGSALRALLVKDKRWGGECQACVLCGPCLGRPRMTLDGCLPPCKSPGRSEGQGSALAFMTLESRCGLDVGESAVLLLLGSRTASPVLGSLPSRGVQGGHFLIYGDKSRSAEGQRVPERPPFSLLIRWLTPPDL